MKLVFVANRIPYPPFRGDKLKIFNLACCLAPEHELHLITFYETKKELEYEELLIKRIDEDKFITNKKFVKNRINKRIEIINTELNQQIVEEHIQIFCSTKRRRKKNKTSFLHSFVFDKRNTFSAKKPTGEYVFHYFNVLIANKACSWSERRAFAGR